MLEVFGLLVFLWSLLVLIVFFGLLVGIYVRIGRTNSSCTGCCQRPRHLSRPNYKWRSLSSYRRCPPRLPWASQS